MADYRLNYLNRQQRVTRSRALSCGGDDEAIDRAALVSHAGALELWRDGQKVWRFEPRGRRPLRPAAAAPADEFMPAAKPPKEGPQ